MEARQSQTTRHKPQYLLRDSVVVESTDSISDLGVILDSELSMRRHVGKLSSSCCLFTYVACVSSGGCSIRRRDNDSFTRSSFHATSSQRRACWSASLHDCTYSACTARSSAVRRRSASARSYHRCHAVATLATGCLSDSLQALSCDVRCP